MPIGCAENPIYISIFPLFNGGDLNGYDLRLRKQVLTIAFFLTTKHLEMLSWSYTGRGLSYMGFGFYPYPTTFSVPSYPPVAQRQSYRGLNLESGFYSPLGKALAEAPSGVPGVPAPVKANPSPAEPIAQVNENTKHRPAEINHNHPDDKRVLNKLQFVKVAYSGITGGLSAALLFGVPFKIAFGVELAKSIFECLLARKIYMAQTGWAANLLQFSNRITGGPNKPVYELTRQEKDRSLAPISALGSIIGCLAVAGINFQWTRRHATHLVNVSPQKLAWQIRHAPLLKKILPALRLLGHRFERLKPIQWLHQRPNIIFPYAAMSGLFWGLMEWVAAEKLAQSSSGGEKT